MTEEGADVTITGQNTERVNTAVANVGSKAFGLTAASQDAKTPARVVKAVKDCFGSLDILFANAGVSWPAPLGQIDSSAVGAAADNKLRRSTNDGAGFTAALESWCERFLHDI